MTNQSPFAKCMGSGGEADPNASRRLAEQLWRETGAVVITSDHMAELPEQDRQHVRGLMARRYGKRTG